MSPMALRSFDYTWRSGYTPLLDKSEEYGRQISSALAKVDCVDTAVKNAEEAGPVHI